MTINGIIHISHGMLHRLRHKEWLTCWDIAAALEMVDRTMSVKLSLSIPLHTEGSSGNSTPISNPFHRWKRTIDDYRRQDKTDCPGIYFCPLNLNANHFTLLEINEQTRMIYHYDSMASSKTIGRKSRSTLVRREVEVS